MSTCRLSYPRLGRDRSLQCSVCVCVCWGQLSLPVLHSSLLAGSAGAKMVTSFPAYLEGSSLDTVKMEP